MKNKLRKLLIVLAVSPVLMAAECPAPGSKGPSGPTYDKDTQSCNIVERNVNSKGQWFVALDCNLDSITDSAEVLTSNDQYPKCNVNTYWPACKDA